MQQYAPNLHQYNSPYSAHYLDHIYQSSRVDTQLILLIYTHHPSLVINKYFLLSFKVLRIAYNTYLIRLWKKIPRPKESSQRRIFQNIGRYSILLVPTYLPTRLHYMGSYCFGNLLWSITGHNIYHQNMWYSSLQHCISAMHVHNTKQDIDVFLGTNRLTGY